MRYSSPAALITICALAFYACSVARPRADIRHERVAVTEEHQAWNAARTRLHSMCPAVPQTEAELIQALKTRQGDGCHVRLAKDTYLPTVDDWHWHWLPPYRVVAAVHDEELRKRVIPKHYEEYMSGLNRYLAEKADRGQITPAQFKYAFNAAWNWLTAKIRHEKFLLQQTGQPIGSLDSRSRRALDDVAGELATVTTLALAISAPDKRYEPTPAACYAHVREERSYTIQCY